MPTAPATITTALRAVRRAWMARVPLTWPTDAEDSRKALAYIFGRATAPRATYDDGSGAKRAATDDPLTTAIASVMRGAARTELTGIRGAWRAVGPAIDDEARVLAGLMRRELTRNAIRGAERAVSLARASGEDPREALLWTIGVPPDAVTAILDDRRMAPARVVEATLRDTLVHDAIERGRYTAMRALARQGTAVTKTWISRMDGRERPSHRALHETTIGLRESFNDAGVQRDVPGGWNCRCTLTYATAAPAEETPS